MLFNSFIFVLFFIIVYTLYLFLNRNYKAQNILLLIASYVFYGWWDWRFLSLLALSTVVDFTVGKQLQDIKEDRKRKLLLCISLVFNLSLLGFFKYFNFFAESFSSLLQIVGLQVDWVTLTILLPVGISFYTFQTMSYTIDIYRGKLKPISNFLDFALFVSFFPQLVAGPIERATTLIPQIILPRNLNIEQINAGILLIVWGYFKKVVIADNMATIANPIFNNYTQYQGLDVLIGILAFTVQIYGDFSGYSDIARGISKLMGFELMVNFKLPYFALNPSDFWLRWHISLSTWLRDYLYIPL
ncbi:MAG: MBOAT family protein, partial [Moorea sp. SIO3G5]|nr:MBOAT family protein [Moorena sp. SIO3G5]